MINPLFIGIESNIVYQQPSLLNLDFPPECPNQTHPRPLARHCGRNCTHLLFVLKLFCLIPFFFLSFELVLLKVHQSFDRLSAFEGLFRVAEVSVGIEGCLFQIVLPFVAYLHSM